MAEKKPNRLSGLVKDATSDITAEVPLRRGRGLEGMLSDEPAADPATIQQAGNQTSQQVHNQVSRQAGKQASKEDVARTVKSYRIRDDLAYRIDVLARVERRKIYEVIEEALDLYLRARDEEQTERGA